MSDLLTIEQRNNRRLAKIHKLKRENKVLGARCKAYYNFNKTLHDKLISYEGRLFSVFCIKTCSQVRTNSELTIQYSKKMERNSLKIQKLRVLISQSK